MPDKGTMKQTRVIVRRAKTSIKGREDRERYL